ncbi:FG-GAP repeat protein [candidate division KSB1 bacterium]|nr:FG-GAP repeat protein [candidate division KSB1 bacterium]
MDNTADVTMNGEGSDNFFGTSVSGAGDVNSDNYADVIVGAYGYNSEAGRAYVYYGGSAMNNTADVLLDGAGTWSNFGRSVSSAGDVNNDGYADVIVGASNYNFAAGRAYIYYGGSIMDNTEDVLLDGEGTGNFFGNPVSGVGDVNYDGYDDVIIGAHKFPWNGKAYVYAGDSTETTDKDKDGCPDSDEGIGDRDGDGIPNHQDYDPTGYFYDEADARIVSGGSITVTGPGAITMVQNGSSGYYQFLTDGTAGIYTIHVTLPPNYLWSLTCLNQGILNPPANPNPYVIGNGENGNSGYLTSNACTQFYLQFDLEANDPFVFNNNFPLSNQTPTAIALSSFYVEVGQDGILIYWITETEPDNAGFNIYRSTEENGDYSKINDSLIPALGDATIGASYSYVDKPDRPGDYYYKLQSISLSGETSFHGPVFVGVTSVDLKKYAVPDNYSLSQNYPNPFNPTTEISFGLPKAETVKLSIYNTNGQLILTLVNGFRSAGYHQAKWNGMDESGSRVTSGMYVYVLQTGETILQNKMILIK